MLEKWTKTLVVSLVVLLSGSLATAADKISSGDKKFIKEAAEGGMMEVELGKLAAQKAASEKVKEFGRRMEQDHGKANQELQQLAASKSIELPQKLEDKQKSTVERLSKLSGDKFDREYMKVMLDDHKQDLEKFQQEANKAEDADIKKFASKQVPTLKKHLELAREAGQQQGSARSK